MHCPKPYSYRRAATPIIVADSCHQTAHMHILCDTTTHHSQQTTANCPQHQGCIAVVAVSQPFVSRAPRSVHLCKQKWGIARTALQAWARHPTGCSPTHTSGTGVLPAAGHANYKCCHGAGPCHQRSPQGCNTAPCTVALPSTSSACDLSPLRSRCNTR
jgi:hypothetical protein